MFTSHTFYVISLTILFLFCGYNNLKGQQLKGQILDADNKSQIPFATISINSVQKSQTILSDSSGFFSSNTLDFGRYNVRITCVGYEPSLYPSILVTGGKQTSIIVYLKPSNEILADVVVQATTFKATTSSKRLNIEQTDKYAATWGDPARMALSFAGVSNVNDQSNELVIRGNSPKGLLWMIEGIEIPSPNHFSAEGASGGLIGALSSTVLQNSTFYTGAFSANYGNALSGVFDLSLRNGNDEKREYSINTSLLGVNVGMEGPFSKKHKDSYLVNYRFANTRLINSLGLSQVLNASSPKFEDLTFKFKFQRKKAVLTLWGVGGKNTTDFSVSQFLEIQNRANFYATGLKWFKEFSKKLVVESTISYSGNENVNNRKQIFTDQSEGRQANLQNQSIRFVNNAYYRLADENTLHFGSIVSQLSYNLFGAFDFIFDNLNVSASDTSINSVGKTYTWQNFGLILLKKEKWDLNLGIHSNYFFLNKQLSLEPRASVSFTLNDRQRLNFGFGIHSRLEPLNIYLYKNDLLLNGKVVDNINLGVTKAAHFVLGFDNTISKDLQFNTEIYYQHLYDVGVGNSAILPGIDYISLLNQINSVNLFPLTSDGFGTNYGWEVTVEKPLNKGFYGLFTSSIFRSFYKNGVEQNKYPSRYDNRFVINTLAGKEWIVNKNLINLNFRVTYAGGIRQLPVSLINGVPNTIYEIGYTERLNNYFRVDLKGSYIFSVGKTTTTASLDINNAFDRANPLTSIFNPITSEYEVINQLGILPVLSLKFDF
jgi:hypothetical protein